MMTGDDLERRRRPKDSSRTESYVRTETYWTSWLIPVFVVANIAVFVVIMYVNNCPKHNRMRIDGKCVARFLGRFSFQPLKENPLFGASSNTLEKLGALQWMKIVHGHQAWRLVTANWLHAGLIHLVANMLSIVLIGIRLEQQFGFCNPSYTTVVKITIVELVSTRRSDLYFVGFWWKCSFFFVYSKKHFGWCLRGSVRAAALLTLVVIVVVNLAVGILPFVDNFAHIGGFLTGFLLGFILLPRPRFGWLERHTLPADVRVNSKYKVYQYVLGLLALVLIVAGFTVGLVMLFHGENGYKRCHWCSWVVFMLCLILVSEYSTIRCYDAD
ncbi:hypothetical protein R6Q59_001672 [Mikania micrantha]